MSKGGGKTGKNKYSWLLGLAAVVILAVIGKNWILENTVEQAVSRITGFKTEIGSLNYNFPSTLQIKELNIQNPAGFEQKIFVKMPEIYASLALGELIQGKRMHIREIRLDLAEVNVEKKKDGVSNIQLLSSIGGGAKPAEKKAGEPAPKKEAMPFLLDRLELSIGNVRFADHSGIIGAAPVNALAVDLNVDKEVFQNIQDPMTLVNLIVVKVLNGATLGKLLDIDPKALAGENLEAVMTSGKELAAKGTEFANAQLAGAKDQLGNAVNQATQAVSADKLIGGTSEAVSQTAAEAKQKLSGLVSKIKFPASGEQES